MAFVIELERHEQMKNKCDDSSIERIWKLICGYLFMAIDFILKVFISWRSEIAPWMHHFILLSVHNIRENNKSRFKTNNTEYGVKDWYLKLKSTQCHLLLTFICIYIYTHTHRYTQVVGIWTKPFMQKIK